MKTSALCIKELYKKIWVSIAVLIAVLMLFKPFMKIMFPVLYTDRIAVYSRCYGVDKHLVMAIISVESKFNKDAVSHKGAKGLMQIRDKTALWCMEKFEIYGSIDDLYNPDLNIDIGCAYIKYLTEKFCGDTDTILASYNAGEGNVKKWLGDKAELDCENIPFKETKNYVKKVNKRKSIYKFLY